MGLWQSTHRENGTANRDGACAKSFHIVVTPRQCAVRSQKVSGKSMYNYMALFRQPTTQLHLKWVTGKIVQEDTHLISSC